MVGREESKQSGRGGQQNLEVFLFAISIDGNLSQLDLIPRASLKLEPANFKFPESQCEIS